MKFVNLTNIRSNDFLLLLLFFLYSLCIGMFITVGFSIGDSLFLANVSQDKVNSLYAWGHVGIAAAAVVITWGYNSIIGRLVRIRLLVGMQLFLMISVFGFHQLLIADTLHAKEWLYFGLVIWLKVCGRLSMMLFFSFAGDYFTTRTAKRRYGYLAGGLSVGTIIAGIYIGPLVSAIGSENILFLCMGFLIGGIGFSLVIHKVGIPVTQWDRSSKSDARATIPLRKIASQTYIQFAFLVVLIGLICFVVVDVQMKISAKQAYPNVTALAEFFGTFYTSIGMTEILIQFLLVEFLLRQFGIIHCLLILPGIHLIMSALFYFTGYGFFANHSLFIITTANFFRIVLTESLELPSRELLFLPLPSHIRVRAQSVMKGMIEPIGQGIGGLLVMSLAMFGIQVFRYSLIVLCLALVWIALLVYERQQYRDTLIVSLKDHQFDSTELQDIIQGTNMDFVLGELLKSNKYEVISFTLELLRNRRLSSRLAIQIQRLAVGRNPVIAAKALELLGAEGTILNLETVKQAFKSSSVSVRRAAVIAFCQIKKEEALDGVNQWLKSADNTMKYAALVGCGRYCGQTGVKLVTLFLERTLSQSSPETRGLATELIREIGNGVYLPFVEKLLDDEVMTVRLKAVRACGAIRDPSLVPHLLKLYGSREMRGQVIEALTQMPEKAVPTIIDAVPDFAHDEMSQNSLFQVLASIGGSAAEEALWRLFSGDFSLLTRSNAGNALWRVALSSSLEGINTAEFDGALKKRCHTIRLLNQAYQEIGESDEFTWQLLRDHAHLEIENLFHLLALKYDMTQLEKVRYNMFHSQGIQQANALELLDEILPRRIAPDILHLLDAFIEGKPSSGKRLSDVTAHELMQEESWLKVVTIYHLSDGVSVPCSDSENAFSDQEQSLYQFLNMITFLKKVPLLKEVPGNYLVPVAKIAHMVDLHRGDVLFQQGDWGDAMYLIAYGAIRVLVNEVEVNLMGVGEGIGEMALLDGSPRSASCIAAEDSELVKIEANDFEEIVKNQPDVALALLRTLAGRLRQLTANPVQQEDASPEGYPDAVNASLRAPFSSFLKEGQGGFFPQQKERRFEEHEQVLYHLFERIAFLKKVPLFRDVPDDYLVPLTKLTDSMSMKPGGILFQQGDWGDAMYLIRHGSISVQVNGIEVNQMGVGECIGEMSLLDDVPRSAACIAREDTELLKIKASDFETVMRSQPSVVFAMLRTLAARLRQQTAKTTFST